MRTREFIYKINYAARRRLAGGRNYMVTVWENRGPGKIELVGEGLCCTAAHKGEDCEAWSIVINKLPRILRRFPPGSDASKGYLPWCEAKVAKVQLTRI